MGTSKENRRSLLSPKRMQLASFDGVNAYPTDDVMTPSTVPLTVAPPPKIRPFDFLGKTWPRAFFIVVGVQSLICLAFEAYVFGKFQTSQGPHKNELDSQYKTIPTFLALFIFAFLYEWFLTWDALRLTNTIQIIGLCVANVIFLIYTALQVDQIGSAITALQAAGALDDQDVWGNCKPYLVAIPIIFGFGSVCMGLIAWRLYREFAWDILKQMGADIGMKRRYLHYQIYIALLKFDFFFFLGFTVQFLVIVNGVTNTEETLTACAIPVTIIILLCAHLFNRRELRWGVCVIIALYFGGLAYFFFKLVRIYQPGHAQNYLAVRRSLTAFAVITIVLIILTILNAFICMNNFGKGLMENLDRAKAAAGRGRGGSRWGRTTADKEAPVEDYALGGQQRMQTRMTID